MKKSLFYNDITQGYIRGKCLQKGWSLCIGAGTSLGVFPSWDGLVRNLIKKDVNTISDTQIDEILNSFSYDALIQAASVVLNKNEEEFHELLSEEIYCILKNNVSNLQFNSIKKIFTSKDPNKTTDIHWRRFIEVREKYFKNTTAYGLGKIVRDSYYGNVPPDGILSFNAEPLLYSLINSFEREKYLGQIKKKGDISSLIDLVTISISNKTKGRIPYYFCHGALLSNLREKDYYTIEKATSNLVFSESEYLQLANLTYSWQASNFLNLCTNTCVIFIGLSFTDSNMRKWLTWIQNERSSDLPKKNDSTQHFWINVKPKHLETIRWMEAAVLHLGIRIIWIDHWGQVEAVMRKLIGM